MIIPSFYWAKYQPPIIFIINQQGFWVEPHQNLPMLKGSRGYQPSSRDIFCQLKLVGGWATPLKNMNVNWDDEIPNIWENKIDVPNHQPEIAATCLGCRRNPCPIQDLMSRMFAGQGGARMRAFCWKMRLPHVGIGNHPPKKPGPWPPNEKNQGRLSHQSWEWMKTSIKANVDPHLSRIESPVWPF